MELAVTNKYNEGKQYVFASNRLDTFTHWPFNEDDSPCRAEKVAEAGFICTMRKDKDAPTAACVFCGKELEFEEGDEPWAEHVKRGAQCEFVTIGKLDERIWTVKDYMLLLAAAHTNQTILSIKKDMDHVLEAGNEVKKMISTITKK